VRSLSRLSTSEIGRRENIDKITKHAYFLFMVKCLPLLPLTMVSIYFLAQPFISDQRLQWGFSIGMGFLPFVSVVRVLYARRTSTLRLQSKVLMQSLCTSVSGGYSIERAFLCARVDVEKAFGKHTAYSRALRDVEHELTSHESLDCSLTHMCQTLDYYELLPIFHALSIQKVVGNQIVSILRNSCQMLSELQAVKSEVDANNAGKNTEALLLCIMPFGITYLLQMSSKNYMQQAEQSSVGQILMMIAFAFAVASCALLFSGIGEKPKKVKQIRSSYLSNTSSSTRLRALIDRLPSIYTTKIYEWANELSFQSHAVIEEFFRSLLMIVIGCLLSIPLLLYGLHISLWFSIPLILLFIILKHVDLKNDVNQRRLSLMDDMPLFISMMSTLLESGILLPKAISTCAFAFSNESVLHQELSDMMNRMEMGNGAADTLEAFSNRVSIPEAQAALLLASRYERSGGKEVLGLLRLQSSSCWSLCRNASRKKREREAFSMIFPMMLDFVSVLLVAIAPAIQSFQSF